MSLQLRHAAGHGDRRGSSQRLRGLHGCTRWLARKEAIHQNIAQAKVCVKATGFITAIAFRNYSSEKYPLLVCLLFFPPSLFLPFPPSILHVYPIYNFETVNPLCNSAIPTEVGAFTPGVNPSPVPLLLPAGGLPPPFPSAGVRHHMAELLHLLRGVELLLWLLLSAQQARFGAIRGCGSSDCSILQVPNRGGRADGETPPTRASQSFISSHASEAPVQELWL